MSREGVAVLGSTERGVVYSRQGERHKQRKLQQMIGWQSCRGQGSSPWQNGESQGLGWL